MNAPRIAVLLPLWICLPAGWNAASGARAQEAPARTAAAGRHGGEVFLPLGPGASWTWRARYGDAAPVEVEWRVLREVEVAGGVCWELRTRRGTTEGYAYWAARPDGILRHENRYLGGWRGVNGRARPRRVLACPAGVVPSWEWEEVMSVQTSGGTPRPSREDLLVRHRAEIEAMREPVEVPAGTFEALRVKTTSVHRTWTTVTVHWWVPDVGLVRKVSGREGEEPTHVEELLRFTPSTPADATRPREEVLAEHLGARGVDRGEGGDVQWVEDTTVSTWFRSAFARVDGDLLRVLGEGVTLFDPSSKDAWLALIREEAIEIGGGGVDDQSPMALVRACAVLVGASRGLGEVAVRGQKTSHDFRSKSTSAEATVHGVTPSGRATSVRVWMEFAPGALTKVEVDR